MKFSFSNDDNQEISIVYPNRTQCAFLSSWGMIAESSENERQEGERKKKKKENVLSFVLPMRHLSLIDIVFPCCLRSFFYYWDTHEKNSYISFLFFSPVPLSLSIRRRRNEVRLHSSVPGKSIETVSMRSMMMIDTFRMSMLRTNCEDRLWPFHSLIFVFEYRRGMRKRFSHFVDDDPNGNEVRLLTREALSMLME